MTDPDEAELLEAHRILLQQGFSSGDLDTLGRLLTDEVVWVYRFELGSSRIDRDDHRAVERSNFVSRVANEDGPVGAPHLGSVVIIWLRDGEWRVAAYFDVGAPLFPVGPVQLGARSGSGRPQ